MKDKPQDGTSTSFKCSYEEADSRFIFKALKAKSDVAIVAKEPDVLILLIWAHSQFDIHSKWYMTLDHNSYADISSIVENFGSNTHFF